MLLFLLVIFVLLHASVYKAGCTIRGRGRVLCFISLVILLFKSLLVFVIYYLFTIQIQFRDVRDVKSRYLPLLN